MTNAFKPIITKKGIEHSISTNFDGVNFRITHVSFGGTKFTPTGQEESLLDERLKVQISSSSKINDNAFKIRARAMTDSPFFCQSIAFWSDNILFAVYSSSNLPSSGLFAIHNNSETIVSYTLALEALGADHFEVVVIEGEDMMVELINNHEQDPHAHGIDEIKAEIIENISGLNDQFLSLQNADGYKFIGRCKSIEELRTIEPTTSGQRILVDSYYLGGTTGGGEFVYDEACSDEDNSGTVIVTTGGKCWKRLLNGKVNIEDFGADSAGEQDSTNSINNAIQFCKLKKLKLYSESGIFKTQNVNLDFRELNIDLNSTFILNDDSSYFILGGNALSSYNPDQFINIIRRASGESDRNKSKYVQIVGAKGQRITLNYVYSVELFATERNSKDTSIAYSTFNFTYTPYINLRGETELAWINENTFNLKRCCRFGIGQKGGYQHNNNIINGGTFEGTGEHIVIKNGSCNSFFNIRFEKYQNNSVIFEENAYNNAIYVSWASSIATEFAFNYKYIDNGVSNIISSVNNQAYDYAPVFLLNRETLQFNLTSNATWCSIKGVGCYTGIEPDEQPFAGVLKVQPHGSDLLKVGSWGVIAKTPLIPVNDSYIIVDSYGWSSGNGFRLAIYGYDKDGNKLASTGNDVYLQGVAGNKSFGNVSVTNRKSDYLKILNRNAAYVKVVVRNGSGDATFKSISVASRTNKATAKINGLNDFNFRSTPFNTPNIKVNL